MAVNKVVQSNGTTLIDITPTTAVESDVSAGKIFFLANGTQATGTSSGAPSATSHTIYFEFSDETDTTITAYWDGTFISDAITVTTPTTYGGKTITLAQLDGVTWYEPSDIPIGVELIDFTKLSINTSIDGDGDAYTEQYYYATDYTAVDSNMTFTYKAGTWTRIGVYDSSKACINVVEVWNDGSGSGNVYEGTLSGTKLPSGSAYVRIASPGNDNSYMSLIRTA